MLLDEAVRAAAHPGSVAAGDARRADLLHGGPGIVHVLTGRG
jgi:hypothetical protein